MTFPARLINEARKSVNVLLLGIPAWGATSAPNGISTDEWWRLVAVAAAALLVYVTPNDAPSAP